MLTVSIEFLQTICVEGPLGRLPYCVLPGSWFPAHISWHMPPQSCCELVVMRCWRVADPRPARTNSGMSENSLERENIKELFLCFQKLENIVLYNLTRNDTLNISKQRYNYMVGTADASHTGQD